MKKIYALAAVALMSASAMAQNGAPLYATGGGGFDPQWSPDSPAEFVYANGEYTLEVTNIDGLKISTATGDWDTFNASAIGIKKVNAIDTWTAIEPWGENTVLPWPGDYTIKVKGDLSAIWVHTDTPEPNDKPFLCIRGGSFNDWNNDLEAAAFTNSEGKKEWTGNGWYAFTCAGDQYMEAKVGFKMALNTTWNEINIGLDGETLVPFNEEYPLETGSDPGSILLKNEWNGVCYVDINDDMVMVFFSNDKNAKNPFAGAVNGIVTDANAAPVYYNLQGVRVAQPENGLYIVVKGGKSYKQVVK